MPNSSADLLRKAARINALLAAFVEEKRYVPCTAVGVRDAGALPLAFQDRSRRCGPNAVWNAWRHGQHIWFVIARRRQAAHGKRGLQIEFYDVDARLAACGVWVRTHGRFQFAGIPPTAEPCNAHRASAPGTTHPIS